MIEIATPTAADGPAITALFRDYPYRAFQQRRQGIDPAKLSAMLWEQTEKAMSQTTADFALAASKGAGEGKGGKAGVVGLAGLVPDLWHAQVFGKRMAKIQPFLAYREPAAAGPALLQAVLDHAARRGYEHVSCRLDASDWDSIRLLESRGFYLVDGSQKLARRLGPRPFESAAGSDDLVIDEFRKGEEDRLAAIASRSHTTNHFYNDPALGVEAGRRLFEEWVKRCCRGLARHVFVARRLGSGGGGRGGESEEPVGFVTYLGADALKKHLGLSLIVLDFVVVDAAWQGKGVGRWLLAETLNAIGAGYDWVELRTSYNNYPALALYHKLGFETIASDVILHCVV